MPEPQPVPDAPNGYVIDRVIGRGGMATIYLAMSPAGTPVALKMLDERHHDDVERLRREFTFAARVTHPHVIEVYERGQSWIAMRYVDGGNASRLTARRDQLTALAQIADALDAIHRCGIVHCDVKPPNILVFKNFPHDGAVLTDFGTAHSLAEDMSIRLTQVGAQHLSLDPAKRITHPGPQRPTVVVASLPYAAPEILAGRMPSAATDQYSLACSAFEMLSGAGPFSGSADALMHAQLEQIPPRLSQRVPGTARAADSVIDRALAKDPERRYLSCAEFIDALTRALGS